MNPPISVMTVVYNGERFLQRCYRSLLAQNYPRWEWIVVDDGSRDGTHEVLKSLQRREPRLRLIHCEDNRGRGYARTLALQHARGDWTAVWDVDDLYFPHRLDRIDWARREGFDYYSSTAVVLDRKLRYVGVRGWHYPFPPTSIRAGCHAALAFRTDLGREIGYLPHLTTVGQIGEDVAIGYTLAASKRGLLDDDPTFINVIGHEVFLRKSIDANTVRMNYQRGMFERGELPLTGEQFGRLDAAERRKLRILNWLRVCPSLYPILMSFRPRGRLLAEAHLTEQQRQFIESCRSGNGESDRENSGAEEPEAVAGV
jgi:glycosyltransferase involved in cell wall biosynthesis